MRIVLCPTNKALDILFNWEQDNDETLAKRKGICHGKLIKSHIKIFTIFYKYTSIKNTIKLSVKGVNNMIVFVFRKLFWFFVPLMICSQLALATPTTVNIAILQMPNHNELDGSQVEKNLLLLENAVKDLVLTWKARYKDQTVPNLILLPEFVAAGYYVPIPENESGPIPASTPLNEREGIVKRTTATWRASEPSAIPTDCLQPDGKLKNGKDPKYVHTIEALKALTKFFNTTSSGNDKIAFATTYLEQVGANFYNSFVFVDSNGVEISPGIRKAKSAATEAYYISPYLTAVTYHDSKSNSEITTYKGTVHAFTVPYGTDSINIGVGICYENYHCELADYLNNWTDTLTGRRVHILLAPHSAPVNIDFQKVGQTYVDKLNIPIVALANKSGTGKTDGSNNLSENANFTGISTIVSQSFNAQDLSKGAEIVPPISGVAGTKYIFGHNLPVRETTKGANARDSGSICPVGQDVSSENPYFNLWKDLVKDTITVKDPKTDMVLTPTQIEQIFESIEYAGEQYYNRPDIASLRNTNYWRDLNCHPQ